MSKILNLRRRLHFTEVFLYVIVGGLLLLIIGILPINELVLKNSDNNSYFISEYITVFYILLIVPISLIIYAFYSFSINKKLEKRATRLCSTALSKNMTTDSFVLSPSLKHIAENKVNALQTNHYTSEDWGYCDYQFSQYRQSKYGNHKVKTFYYAVSAFKLPRKLPNVFFDSKKTGSREFRLIFKNSQKHSLEGNFDNYFTTYFHESYSIDSLSFITPEVMQSMMLAGEYDIEIHEDYLYLYNEIEDMPKQLIDMEQKGKAVRQKLLNNILSYRDERINYADGRKTVSLLGSTLRRSRTRYYGYLLIGLILAIPGLFISFTTSEQTSAGFYILATGIGIGFRGFKGITAIRKEDLYNEKMQNIGA